MGRAGAAGDNAEMESFFALLQKNDLDRQRWRTREQLKLAIITWIEQTYHRRRRSNDASTSPPHRIRDPATPGGARRVTYQPEMSTKLWADAILFDVVQLRRLPTTSRIRSYTLTTAA